MEHYLFIHRSEILGHMDNLFNTTTFVRTFRKHLEVTFTCLQNDQMLPSLSNDDNTQEPTILLKNDVLNITRTLRNNIFIPSFHSLQDRRSEINIKHCLLLYYSYPLYKTNMFID